MRSFRRFFRPAFLAPILGLIVYIPIFLSLAQRSSGAAFVMGLLPIIGIAWGFGKQMGVLLSLLLFPLNGILNSLLPVESQVNMTGLGSVSGHILILIVGWVVGYAADLNRELRRVQQGWERDKLELARNELQFRSIFDHSNDAIFLLDAQGNHVIANLSASRLLGYEPAELSKLSFREIVEPTEIDKSKWRISDLIAGKEFPLYERTFVHKDGTRIPVEVNASLIRDEAEKPLYILSIVRDISARKQRLLELETIAATNHAVRLTSTKEEVLTVIAQHSMRLNRADAVMISLIQEETRHIVVELATGEWQDGVGARYSAGNSITETVVQTGESYILNDTSSNVDERIAYPELITRLNSVACVPLRVHEGKIIGVVWMGRQQHIDENDTHLLTIIADIAGSAIHRTALFEERQEDLTKLASLHNIDLALASSTDMEWTAKIAIEELLKVLPIQAAAVFRLDDTSQRLRLIRDVGVYEGAIKHVEYAPAAGIAWQVVSQGSIVQLDLSRQSPGSEALKLNKQQRSYRTYLGVPLVMKGEVKGVLEVYYAYLADPDEKAVEFIKAVAHQLSLAIDNFSLLESLRRSNTELQSAYDTTLEGWAQALDLRDHETQGHSIRVTELAVVLAEAACLSGPSIRYVRQGALLHDIGKLGIPDHILLKPGALTDEEWEVMRQHPVYAYNILSTIPFLLPAIEIPYCHHEKYDGSGYPRGLSGKQIPISARIFAIVDVWDALTSDRPYRKAWSKEDALEYIREQKGKHFDPELTDIFLGIVGDLVSALSSPEL